MRLPILHGAAKRDQILTPTQARYILDCLTLDKRLRREAGFVRRTPRLHQELADRFGVTRHAIKAISKRENWRSLRLAEIYDISETHRNRARNKDA